ncbi:hypothetical protein HNQ36_001036 [Afipia massiliensis]|uniref:Uncharacterized protein n=1 Tax=Afipia massiliensis TaxID=211460 RepID=A0A840MWJ5_9BRAD|nr:hypothetical protein [Afipia massiliensis]MBB5051082.1 hypothetical protein [Afipia massiliensis]
MRLYTVVTYHPDGTQREVWHADDVIEARAAAYKAYREECSSSAGYPMHGVQVLGIAGDVVLDLNIGAELAFGTPIIEER